MPSPSSSGVRELRVVLTVGDFDRAAALYRDGLGLPMVQEWESPQGRGLVLAVERTTFELVDEAQTDYIDRAEVGRRVSGPVRLAFEVADAKATAASLRERGAEVVSGPVPTPWGTEPAAADGGRYAYHSVPENLELRREACLASRRSTPTLRGRRA